MLLGEVSTPDARPARRVVGCRCYDISYGSTETGTLAASCREGSLHLLTATNYFELGTDEGLVRRPDPGRAPSSSRR